MHYMKNEIVLPYLFYGFLISRFTPVLAVPKTNYANTPPLFSLPPCLAYRGRVFPDAEQNTNDTAPLRLACSP
jgi:hypothetical protein